MPANEADDFQSYQRLARLPYTSKQKGTTMENATCRGFVFGVLSVKAMDGDLESEVK